jgi:transposase
VTYGYSRDHREDLKQWMLALVTCGEGVPQFLQPLDGHASDNRALLEAVTGLTHQLQQSGESVGVFVADSGLYSAENRAQLNAAQVQWVSRVPETSTAAQASSRNMSRHHRRGSTAPTGRATGGADGRQTGTRSPGRSACGISGVGLQDHVCCGEFRGIHPRFGQ